MEDDTPKSDRKLLIAGAALALAAGLGGAFLIMAKDDGSSKPPPASQGGLVVQATEATPEDQLDPARPLRCFVNGQFVGELTLAACADKNGVATGSLDVGLDQTGALAATDVAGTVLTPLPPAETEPPVIAAPEPSYDEPEPEPVAASTATCWRYARNGWRQIGEMGRGACAQALFAAQCAGPGSALYGRWGEQTLRLVTGRVEISDNNRRFRMLAEQGPGCSLPSVD